MEVVKLNSSNIIETELDEIKNIGELSLPIYYDKDSLKDIIENGYGYNVFVAKECKKIMGFAITAITEDDNIHIMSLASSPNFRRKKIGTKLINRIKKRNKQKLITLYVQSSNNIAIEFYKKNKFIEIEFIKDYYSNLDNNDAYLLGFFSQ